MLISHRLCYMSARGEAKALQVGGRGGGEERGESRRCDVLEKEVLLIF